MESLLPLLPWALTAGAVATLNPCGFALLPAYLSYLLGHADSAPVPRQLVRGGLAGLSMTTGVMAVFLVAGVIISGLGSALARFIPWLGLTVGGVVAGTGLIMLVRPSVNPSLPVARWANRFGRRTGAFTFVAFGTGYGLASLGCTLPVFLVVTAQALAAGGLCAGRHRVSHVCPRHGSCALGSVPHDGRRQWTAGALPPVARAGYSLDWRRRDGSGRQLSHLLSGCDRSAFLSGRTVNG